MYLMSFPNELLDNIIYYTLPEGLDNLAKTCERFKTLCAPFFERHHQLCARFKDFQYGSREYGSWKYGSRPIGGDIQSLRTAYDLISLIADDPRVSGYIGRADLHNDTSCYPISHSSLISTRPIPSVESGEPMVRLFAESRYLQRAGLDWREYYSVFADDVENNRYSQHGCIFLLTLLPNVHNMMLPRKWSPNAAADKLLYAMSNGPGSSFASSGFPNLVELHVYITPNSRNGNANFSWTVHFLTLPCLKKLIVVRGFAMGTNPVTMAFRDSPYVAENLRRADLHKCCMDAVGITDFLRNTPQLRALLYSHDTGDARLPQDWDICGFINAVAAEAGSHLETLSVEIVWVGSLLPGKATLLFSKLRALFLPLDLVVCNMKAMGITWKLSNPLRRRFSDEINLFLGDLIPNSLEELGMQPPFEDDRGKALGALFFRFHLIRKAQLFNLNEIWITAMNTSKRQWKRIAKEARKEGLQVNDYRHGWGPVYCWGDKYL